MSREKKERKRQQLPRKAQKKKIKKKEKNWMNCPFALAHMYFCPLSIPLFSLQFSLYFGERTFWWVWGENTRAPPFIFLPPTQPNTPQKCFHSHFLSKIFYSPYFSFIQTHPKGAYSG